MHPTNSRSDDGNRIPQRRPWLHHDRNLLLRHPVRRRASHHVDITLPLRRHLRHSNRQHCSCNRHDRSYGKRPKGGTQDNVRDIKLTWTLRSVGSNDPQYVY
jgi:hypothetical protein